MIYNALKQYINNYPYPQEVLTVKSRNFQAIEGHVSNINLPIYTIKQKKIIVPVNPKELVDTGFGQYAGNETYALFTLTPLKIQSGTLLQKTDIIVKDGFDFTIISVENYAQQGFYKYIITKLMENVEND